jgi:hypothetical protein
LEKKNKKKYYSRFIKVFKELEAKIGSERIHAEIKAKIDKISSKAESIVET